MPGGHQAYNDPAGIPGHGAGGRLARPEELIRKLKKQKAAEFVMNFHFYLIILHSNTHS